MSTELETKDLEIICFKIPNENDFPFNLFDTQI